MTHVKIILPLVFKLQRKNCNKDSEMADNDFNQKSISR